jgi:hypothetical protein
MLAADDSAPPTQASRPLMLHPMRALEFEAPFVVEKLVKNHTASTVNEAEQLFTEAKKFIILSQSERVAWEMYSALVDEAWHQFILYTKEYTEFCDHYFGRYVAHCPNNSPQAQSDCKEVGKSMTFADFRSRYEAVYGESLPDVWYDERSIVPTRRVFNEAVGRLTVSKHNGTAGLIDDARRVILWVNDLASEALEFITQTGAFYVRELPGYLTDDEKTALIRALVVSRLLRVAA